MGEQQESPVPDADLVGAALLGAREPFAELVRRHQRTATALAARVLGGEDLARDAVQEAAITAMTGLDRLRAADRFGPWFCGITLNVARRWAARLRPETRYGGPDQPDRASSEVTGRNEAGPEELAELADLGARVRSAIAGLADGQREAVLLFYLHGLSHREVAAKLGISIPAVKARLHQARAVLAPRLAPLADVNTQKGTPMTTRTDAQEWIDVSVAGVRRQGGEPGEPGENLARKHVVVLDAGGGRGRLPIWVGPFEATALAMILESVPTARPLTYQFAARLLEAAGAQATEVRITRLTAGVFYAVVIIDGPGGPGEVDARPSDAITLATIAGVPIRVEAGLLADSTADVADPKWEAYPTGTTELAAEIEQWMLRREAEWKIRGEPC